MLQQFLDEFARPGTPVIITDLDLTKGEPPWTLEFFRERCNKTVQLKQRNASAASTSELSPTTSSKTPLRLSTASTSKTPVLDMKCSKPKLPGP